MSVRNTSTWTLTARSSAGSARSGLKANTVVRQYQAMNAIRR